MIKWIFTNKTSVFIKPSYLIYLFGLDRLSSFPSELKFFVFRIFVKLQVPNYK